MAEEAIKLGGKKKSKFIDQVKEILPEGGNLNLCLTFTGQPDTADVIPAEGRNGEY